MSQNKIYPLLAISVIVSVLISVGTFSLLKSNFIGPQGEPGVKGATGEQGPTGERGLIGPKGIEGDSWVLEGEWVFKDVYFFDEIEDDIMHVTFDSELWSISCVTWDDDSWYNVLVYKGNLNAQEMEDSFSQYHLRGNGYASQTVNGFGSGEYTIQYYGTYDDMGYLGLDEFTTEDIEGDVI